MAWLPLLREILENMCAVIVCQPDCDVKILKLILHFQSSRFFLRGQKVNTKF